MRIENESTLDLFRNRLCERCCSRYMTCVHHLWSRNTGRLDTVINLMTLCADCHAKAHAAVIPRSELLNHVAAREHTLPSTIESVVWLIRRLPKAPAPGDDRIQFWLACDNQMRGMTAAAKEMAGAIIKEAVGP